MNNEIKKVIEKFKEVKNILKDFSTKDEAIEYLVNATTQGAAIRNTDPDLRYAPHCRVRDCRALEI